MISELSARAASAKLYHIEDVSIAVEALVLRSAATILISRLSVIEVQSAFLGRVRSGVISAEDAASLRRRFLLDIANGIIRVVAVSLHHCGVIESLVTADKVLCKVAAAEEIPVADPESAVLPGPTS